jgi:hypothetical protein
LKGVRGFVIFNQVPKIKSDYKGVMSSFNGFIQVIVYRNVYLLADVDSLLGKAAKCIDQLYGQ